MDGRGSTGARHEAAGFLEHLLQALDMPRLLARQLLARALQGFGAEPLTPRLADVRCPTLVLAGERDPAGTAAARSVAARVAGATLEVVAGQDDAPHVGAPDAVATAIRALVARLPQA